MSLILCMVFAAGINHRLDDWWDDECCPDSIPKSDADRMA
jgi:hypothetical protein